MPVPDQPPSDSQPSMSAPSIPNLLSLRGSRGVRGSSRARGRLGPGRGGSRTVAAAGPAHDATIQGTDNDAAVSRLSAVDVGYLDDPYARFFVHSADGPPARRLPIINRGTTIIVFICFFFFFFFFFFHCYSLWEPMLTVGLGPGTYTRTMALDLLVNAFLSDVQVDGVAKQRQIVSLGGGTDTRPFRLFSRPDQCRRLIYHEIDFDVVCRKKLRTVQASPVLSRILTKLSPGDNGASWSSRPSDGDEYYCHGVDLRKLPDPSSESSLLPGLRTDLPTLVVSECCLCYLSPEDASRVIAYFGSQIPDLAVAIYEPTRPDDSFGKIMVSNLAARHIRMPTLDVYREPRDQEDRLRQAGFDLVRHMTIEDCWETWIAPEEKERVDGLEGLDEVEEWKLLAAHYVVVWGSKGDGFPARDGLAGGE